MKKILRFTVFYFFALSCNKNNPSQENTSSLCFDTTFINTNIAGLQSVFFINDKDGFVSTDSGGIYKTTDSAKTWTAVNSGTILPIKSLCFVDSQTGFAGGAFILKTVDGGQSWATVYTPADQKEINSIYFVNQSLGFCVGDNAIFKTADGGATWCEYKINNPGGKLMQIFFSNSQKGYAVGVSGGIFVTGDGGSSWKATGPASSFGYYSVSEADSSLFVSGQGKIIKSVDGGASWNELPNSPGEIFALHFLNDQVGFAFGRGNYSGGDWGHDYGSIYCTENGGNTWNGTADIKEVGLIQSVNFPSTTIGYAISGNKIIRLVRK